MQKEDIQICELLNKGDTKGMKCLFDAYYRPLVLWGATFLHDVNQAEDLVQDFFIKLWEKRARDKWLPSTLKNYLFVSVRNLALNAKVKVDPLRSACDVARFERPWEEYSDFEDEIIRKVEREVEKLPERSREVIKCVYLRGMRYKEVAEELHISVSTVNTLLVHALKKLRQASGGDENVLVFWLYVYSCKSKVMF